MKPTMQGQCSLMSRITRYSELTEGIKPAALASAAHDANIASVIGKATPNLGKTT